MSVRAFADNEFESSYTVTYDVDKTGITTVAQKVVLKNLTSQYYASDFTLTIGSTTISGITASDDAGPMETKVNKEDGKTAITVKFNQQVVGLDKQQDFTLKFQTRDFAERVGKTWEVNLPRAPEGTDVAGYSMVLSVPGDFGDPTSISPQPQSKSQSFGRLFFSFDKSQLKESGVSVNFGSSQIFDFNLKYHLSNDQIFPERTFVALPPDTNFQDVAINRIQPQPLNVTIDGDGNYLAWYELPRRSNLDVTIVGSAKLYINPKNTSVPVLSSQEIGQWTKNDQYWQKNDPLIKNTLADIFNGKTATTTTQKAELIYRYIVNTLSYDTGRLSGNNIERLGAVTALHNPHLAICMEFTDVFIALARAEGIPARELDGFAYSQNNDLRPLGLSHDLLHAWPEYFDEEKGWVMVDPTWENTTGGVDYFNKFDLNHVVFTVRGLSSESPYSTSDVSVMVSPNDFIGKPSPDVQISGQDTIWSGFPAALTVKITNQGNSVQQPTTLTAATNRLIILDNKSIALPAIPPYGFVIYDLNLRTPDIWRSFLDTLKITVGGQTFNKNLHVKPIFLFKPFPYVFLGLVGLVFLGYLAVLLIHLLRVNRHPAKK